MLPANMSPMDKLRLSQWIKSGCPAASVEYYSVRQPLVIRIHLLLCGKIR